MPYPEKLNELIKIVEKTRPERVERKRKGEEIYLIEYEDSLKQNKDEE